MQYPYIIDISFNCLFLLLLLFVLFLLFVLLLSMICLLNKFVIIFTVYNLLMLLANCDDFYNNIYNDFNINIIFD